MNTTNTLKDYKNSKKSDHKPATTKHKRRVLIVEDDLELIAVLDYVCRAIDPDTEIEWATSAEYASVLLQKHAQNNNQKPFDLIVADIFLEGESTGLEIWTLCQNYFPEVPIVITSAISVEKFFNSIGQDAISPPYLAKPFTVKECKNLFESLMKYGNGARVH